MITPHLKTQYHSQKKKIIVSVSTIYPIQKLFENIENHDFYHRKGKNILKHDHGQSENLQRNLPTKQKIVEQIKTVYLCQSSRILQIRKYNINKRVNTILAQTKPKKIVPTMFNQNRKQERNYSTQNMKFQGNYIQNFDQHIINQAKKKYVVQIYYHNIPNYLNQKRQLRFQFDQQVQTLRQSNITKKRPNVTNSKEQNRQIIPQTTISGRTISSSLYQNQSGQCTLHYTNSMKIYNQ
eukprot:TRINITY_DN3024_c0_g1_i6.p1 TRINITY_DN3024_c0_g1~~TRINITY_DN3024_c0_g1_i6.p1  ORF type:complete len:238 (+),score=-15.72 TRINITY_DN3024_c0_g1_i6:290-1003(+)